jgi:hypothetical protein
MQTNDAMIEGEEGQQDEEAGADCGRPTQQAHFHI